MVGMEEINQVGMGLIAYAKASVFKPVYFSLHQDAGVGF